MPPKLVPQDLPPQGPGPAAIMQRGLPVRTMTIREIISLLPDDPEHPRRAPDTESENLTPTQMYHTEWRETAKRRIRELGPWPCPECGMCLLAWMGRPLPDVAAVRQGRCPDCHHINKAWKITQVQTMCDRSGNRLSSYMCVCPCVCTDAEIDDDSDYKPDSESEDEDDEEGLKVEEGAEQLLAQRYGWRTNVLTTQDSGSERRIYYESGAHHSAATSHDIGRPAESSFHNTETTIGRIEASGLTSGIEPWELEAAHNSTGMSYEVLSEMLPGADRLELPPPSPPPAPPLPICPHCRRPPTVDFMEWTADTGPSPCLICRRTIRPENPADDPDWIGHHPSVETLRNYCHCRCICAETNGISLASAQANPDDRQDPRLVRMFRRQVRQEFELPELRFAGGVTLSMLDVVLAHRDAWQAFEDDRYLLAGRLLNFAYVTATQTLRLHPNHQFLDQMLHLAFLVHRHIYGPESDTESEEDVEFEVMSDIEYEEYMARSNFDIYEDEEEEEEEEEQQDEEMEDAL